MLPQTHRKNGKLTGMRLQGIDDEVEARNCKK